MAVNIITEKALAETDNRYRIGAWVTVAGIAMLFTALSSAYIVRAASAPDWRPLQVPGVLWLSTTLLLLSSTTFEAARRQLKHALASAYARWLLITTALGAGFLGLQVVAWRELVRQGIYLASNPHSSFFYLLTAVHGLHLIVGLLALIYLALRSRSPANDETSAKPRRAMTDGVAIYWHFMDALWIYLFVLLFVWKTI